MEQILILNDQGGGVMDVSYDITATLRAQDHGHPPVVLVSYGLEPGAAQRLNTENRFYVEVSPTLRANAGDNQAAVVCIYEKVSDI